jgi:hypothetical protein
MGDASGSDASGSYAPAAYIALSTDGDDPLAADTTLTGEIASGSLARALATYAHTDGTNTYTLTKVFTSDGSVTVRKVGVFNAATDGTLVWAGTLDAEAVLVSGDQVQITVTITL